MSPQPVFRTISFRLIGGVTLTLACALACSGSLKAGASAKAGTDGEAEFDAEGDAAWDQVDASQDEAQTSANATPTAAQPLTGKGEVALLGARHDVMVAPGTSTPCSCLAVTIGQPSSPSLVWTGQRPTTDATSQTVIALSSDGVACSEAGPGASYMGYVKKDGDVIVTVEAAVAGRPITHGAIIPKPDSGKQIYLQPSGKIPYGKGPSGEARCALGSGQ